MVVTDLSDKEFQRPLYRYRYSFTNSRLRTFFGVEIIFGGLTETPWFTKIVPFHSLCYVIWTFLVTFWAVELFFGIFLGGLTI